MLQGHAKKICNCSVQPIVSPTTNDGPRLWIVAGPNGSGKTSIYDKADIEDFGRSVWIINPDALAKRIADVEGLEPVPANLEAVRRIEQWLYASIEAHQTVGVETVLSTPKYRSLVLAAKQRRFTIRLIYVVLNSPELNIERVRLRVAKGGHNVPSDKIVERRGRSLRQLPWFLAQADDAWLFDNSGEKPQSIGTKSKGEIKLQTNALPEIVEAARLARLEPVAGKAHLA
jgi:predicted ABC-type ATPase